MSRETAVALDNHTSNWWFKACNTAFERFDVAKTNGFQMISDDFIASSAWKSKSRCPKS